VAFLDGANGIYTAPDTLQGSLTAVSGAGLTGQGTGYFDVAGGLAAAYLDTNGEPGGADFTYTSSFQPIPGGAVVNGGIIVATHFGTNEVQGNSVPEPHPRPPGLGLVGLGMARRNKKSPDYKVAGTKNRAAMRGFFMPLFEIGLRISAT